MIVLISPIAVCPFLIAIALPVDETAVVNLCGSAAGRLRLRRRRALIVLESPIAVDPLLIAIALPVDETAVVDVFRAPGQGRSAENYRA